MELRHPRYFIGVAEEQNVTRAAARLHISQPPLTRQIHDLEDELGFALFLRTGKTVRLTDAGRIFLEEARAVLLRLETAVASARSVATGVRGELHIGYAPSPTAEFLPAALQVFQRKFPGVRVSLRDQSSPEMLAALRDRSQHAALMMQPPAQASTGIVFEPLRTHDIVVAVPVGHRFILRRGLTLGEVTKEPIVVLSRKEYPDYHALLRRILGRSLRQLTIAQECDSGMSLIAAVEGGKGVAFTVSALVRMSGRRLRFVPLAPAPRATVGIAYVEDSLTPTARAFIESVRGACEVRKGAKG